MMKLSAYTRYEQFLSHPDNKLLIDHLIKVGNKAKEISSQTDLNCADAAYYAGLLHDLGKLNPFYQEIFHADAEKRKATEELSLQTYVQIHSPFSAWAAHKLLGDKTGLDEKSTDMTIHTIYGHHSNLKNILPKQDTTENYKNSQMAISHYLNDFLEYIKSNNDFSLLDWDFCLSNFERPIKFKSVLESDEKNYLFDFIRSSCIFSALLQADRGSFAEWNAPNFGIHFDTDKLMIPSKLETPSKLGYLREEFQKHALENHDTTSGVLVLEAPTGIGKTKTFLDLISRYTQGYKLERVYYFSPLLALTEDFEKKIFNIISNKEQERILVYNHLFSGSLEDKRTQESGVSGVYHWDFENESFNREFIITTTQRLLLTLFSNRQSDKLKLLSFKNSLLIIDEVQTIPKWILPILVGLFEQIATRLNSKILLVSATIPYELRDVKKISIQNKIKEEYLQKTFKRISFLEPFEVPNELTGRVLFMSNTRKKNLSMYEKINQEFGDDHEIIYLSSGISKKDKRKRLEEIKQNSIVVSTQVIEAGVDVSFDKMYREAAPLDNIIQAMGRLNREGENNDAVMTVFKDTRDDWLPYSKLEWQESLKVINRVHSSKDLYDELPLYYQKIWEENKTNEEASKKLVRLMTNLDYEGIWEFIKENALPDDDQEAVFIPENETQWNQIKNTFFSKDDLEKKKFRRFALLTANLSKSPEKLGIQKFFDEELYEKNILLPKWEHIGEVYDKIVGLDKWLKDVTGK
jgi:CRISPR-associated endonuclease/helicase Cas3